MTEMLRLWPCPTSREFVARGGQIPFPSSLPLPTTLPNALAPPFPSRLLGPFLVSPPKIFRRLYFESLPRELSILVPTPFPNWWAYPLRAGSALPLARGKSGGFSVVVGVRSVVCS